MELDTLADDADGDLDKDTYEQFQQNEDMPDDAEIVIRVGTVRKINKVFQHIDAARKERERPTSTTTGESGLRECPGLMHTNPHYRDDVCPICNQAAWNTRPSRGEAVPDDVRRLVIAARRVAFEDTDKEHLRELDLASEAFADRIPWENEDE